MLHLFIFSVKSQNFGHFINSSIFEIGNEWIYEYEYKPCSTMDSINILLMKQATQKIDRVVMRIVEFDVVRLLGLSDKEDREIEDLKDRLLEKRYPPLLRFQEAATIIENDKKVWIHPPRQSFFRILAINPFPYILKPHTIGREWSWSLEVGQQFGDKRWKEWEGNLTIESHYKIIGDTILYTNMGRLHCYIVHSYAVSSLGRTYLTSFFNRRYGFVRLDYTNIDGSKIILNLVEHNSGSRKADFFRVGTIKK